MSTSERDGKCSEENAQRIMLLLLKGVEDFVRQSHLMNVAGLKTAGFLMLVEGSGIGP